METGIATKVGGVRRLIIPHSPNNCSYEILLRASFEIDALKSFGVQQFKAIN